MASKRDEMIAWNMLKKAFPDTYVTIDLEYVHYTGGNKDKIMYHAYVDSIDQPDLGLGKEFESPIDAVRYLINKRKGGKECRLISKRS